jgi:uncharacterized RDD family membrane protein YckC
MTSTDNLPTPELNQPETLFTDAPYAGFWRRGAALWVDTLVSGLVALVPHLVVVLTTYLTTRQLPGGFSADLTPADLWHTAVDIVVYFAYFAWFDVKAEGITPGRRVAGIALHSCDGHAITLSQSLLRQLGKWVSMLVLGIGYKVQPFTRRKQTWHDKWSRTVVVMSGKGCAPWLVLVLNVLGSLVTMAYLAFAIWQTLSQMTFAP